MTKHNTIHMSQPEQEADDLEEYRERARKIIEQERDILDRLAD